MGDKFRSPFHVCCIPNTTLPSGHSFSNALSTETYLKDSGNELTFFSLPLLFQNSAAFLEESKQNKCDCLKNYWKTRSEHSSFEWLSWAEDASPAASFSPHPEGVSVGKGRGSRVALKEEGAEGP